MQRFVEQELYGWGRFPRIHTQIARPELRGDLLAALKERESSPMLACGNLRSYGDQALLSDGKQISTLRLNRFLDFDEETGWLRCEAGVLLEEIIDVFLPRGFFPPVVPGTKLITVGGAIGNDIHGKNHHVDGTFCDHIRNVEILLGSGEIVFCDAEHNADLFWATVGGMGLTGIILSAEVQLTKVPSPFIDMESIRVENLDHFFEVSEASAEFTHAVSWIDCVATGEHMGRGIFMRGRPAEEGETREDNFIERAIKLAKPILELPVDLPNWVMGKAFMKVFNEVYYRKQMKAYTRTLSKIDPFFFPLDFVRGWNRGYGPRGFLQYQFVVPADPEHRVIREALSEISKTGMASFLAVIKEFGDRDHGGLSFPRGGVTLAMDFPNFGAPLFELFDRLDDIVIEAGGRVYLGKDARLSKEHFQKMYPNWAQWKETRDKWDPDGVFESDLGRRLGLVGAAS